jgi:dTDP-4-dehydrorhamnose 3,5-epimerase
MEEPRILVGEIAVDDRGEVGFVNSFSFPNVKRFYTVSNHRQGFVRAWHGHKHETKYVTVVRGSILVCCVAVDNWANPSPNLPIHRFVLSEKRPAVLHIPGGYAHGTMSLTKEALAVFFSTASLKESQADDFRFASRTWDAWSIEER